MPAKYGEFDKKMQKLQKIIQELEKKDLSLEKGVQLFKEGMTLTQSCREQLEKAKHELNIHSEHSDPESQNHE